MSLTEEQLKRKKEEDARRSREYYERKKTEIAERRKEARCKCKELKQKEIEANKPRLTRAAATAQYTTKDEVIKAFKEDKEYFKNEDTRKTNIQQIPLIFRAIDDEPLLDWIKKPQELINRILDLKQTAKKKEGQPYALSGFSKIIGAVLIAIKILNIPFTPEQDKIIFNSYRTAKLNYDLFQFKTEHPILNRETAVPLFSYFIQKGELKGKTSLHYLMAMLYNEAPLRNNYSNMILIKSKEDIQPKNNYMILPEGGGNASIYIQKHKTIRTSGIIETELSSNLTDIIKSYKNKNNINYGDKLFNELKEVLYDLTNDREDKTDGGSRLLRKSAASTLYDKYVKGEANATDIYNQINVMGHSSNTHFKDYVRGVKNIKIVIIKKK